MPTRRYFIALVLATAVAGWSSLPARASAATAQEFIVNLGNQAIETLTGSSVTDAEREQRFRQLFVANFDVPAIGRTVLGRYWRTATPAEQSEYLKAFEDYIVQTYASRFKQYTGQQFKVLGIKEDRDNYATVQTVVKSPNGEDAQVLWRVRSKDGQMKIVDVVVEGVSMVITQQRDFASVVQQNGGSVEALIQQLRKKTQN
jgi:phospholipid transport system substrate-binding protein